MDSLCRLCSLKSPNLISVFAFKKERLLCDMIHIICPIRIDASDDLPKKICFKCMKSTIEAIELRERSAKSDTRLRSALNKREVIEINQEFDPFYSTMFFETEDTRKRTRQQYESGEEEEESDNGGDSDYCPIIPMIPKVKKVQIKRERVTQSDDDDFVVNLQDVKKNVGTNSTHFCDFCGQLMSTAACLRRHVKRKHPEHFIPKESDYFPSENEDEDVSSEMMRKFHSILFKGSIERFADKFTVTKFNYYEEQTLKKNTRYDRYPAFKNIRSFILKCAECHRKFSGFPETNSHITRHAKCCFDYVGGEAAKKKRFHKQGQPMKREIMKEMEQNESSADDGQQEISHDKKEETKQVQD